jgi:hypothetical protein
MKWPEDISYFPFYATHKSKPSFWKIQFLDTNRRPRYVLNMLCRERRNSCLLRNGFVIAALFLAAILAAACSSRRNTSEYDLTAAWGHTESKDGPITTIHTTQGSVWRGRAQLVEELSIGSETGAEPYLFGQIAGIAGREDRVFILDSKLCVLRMYDGRGHFLRDIARKGEGPGEFVSPSSFVVNPRDGRLFVQDASRGRVSVFSPDGDYLESWRIKAWSWGLDMVAAADGTLYIDEPVPDSAVPGLLNMGIMMIGYGRDGASGKTVKIPRPDFKPAELVYYRRGNITARWNVPFSSRAFRTMSPSGAMVHGVSADYRIDVEHASGGMTRVIKSWNPVPVYRDEKEWHTRAMTAACRRVTPGWSWDGPAVPDFKPAYKGLFTDLSGRIWVIRQGRGRRVKDCQETPVSMRQYQESPCWIDSVLIDVFEETGRYLGEVEVPDGLQFSPPPFIRDGLVLAVVMDRDGNERVKRFRLTLP